MTTLITPNSPDPVQTTATDTPAVPSLDSIAQKMAAMREHTERNQLRATEQTATGIAEESAEPVAHESVEPEVADTEDTDIAGDDLIADAPEEVSTDATESTSDELIDFIEFAETNPNAKFKLSSVDRKFLARAVATLHDVPSDKGNACDDALVKHMNDTADLVPLL